MPIEVCGNIFLRKSVGNKKGRVIDGHKHHFDHTTIVFTGAVHIKKVEDGQVVEQDFKAPAHCLIKAGVNHEITIVEDGTEFWCVYAHRTPNGEVVQEYTGWTQAYS